ncbi:MAG: hypothetical protein WD423_05845 [Rhodothermales bacterium]
MTIINTHEATTRLSELLCKLKADEEIIIGRAASTWEIALKSASAKVYPRSISNEI